MPIPERFHPPVRNAVILFVTLIEMVLIPSLAAGLLAGSMSLAGLTQRMTPALWFLAAPALYYLWVLTYLSICALSVQLFLRSYVKPRHFRAIHGSREMIK